MPKRANLETVDERAMSMSPEEGRDYLRDVVASLWDAEANDEIHAVDFLPINLTRAQRLVLICLWRGKGAARARETLHNYSCVRYGDITSSPKTVDQFIFQLRQIVPQLGMKIHTVWGFGYRLEVPEAVRLPAEKLAAEAREG